MATLSVRGLLSLILLMSLSFTTMTQAQQPPATPTAPLPAQLVNAKRVFVSNGGGDNGSEISRYTNGPDGLYNQFYADVKALGRYDLVSSPADADIVLEIGYNIAYFPRDVSYPKLKLEVRDPRTNVLLWSFTEGVNWAGTLKSGRKHLSEAIEKLADDLKNLRGTS